MTTAIFLHIPKAAGSTLSSVVWRQYPPNRIYSIYGKVLYEEIQRFIDLPEEKKATIECLIGHFHYGIHKHLPQAAEYFTMMRNPIDRVCSAYRYTKSQKDNWIHDLVVDSNMTLEEFVTKDGHTSLAARNFQTRFLADVPLDRAVEAEDFERARQHLTQRIKCCGIVEQFDESLLLLQQTFGWKYVYYVLKNVTPNKTREKQTNTELEVIRQYNQYDIALYDLSKKQFESAWKAYQQKYPGRLQRFRRMNRWYTVRCNLKQRWPRLIP